MSNSSDSDYADIIDLQWPIPTHRTPMPMSARAAQFAPFAALGELEAPPVNN